MKNKFVSYCLGVYLFCFDADHSNHWVNPVELVSKNLRLNRK